MSGRLSVDSGRSQGGQDPKQMKGRVRTDTARTRAWLSKVCIELSAKPNCNASGSIINALLECRAFTSARATRFFGFLRFRTPRKHLAVFWHWVLVHSDAARKKVASLPLRNEPHHGLVTSAFLVCQNQHIVSPSVPLRTLCDDFPLSGNNLTLLASCLAASMRKVCGFVTFESVDARSRAKEKEKKKGTRRNK